MSEMLTLVVSYAISYVLVDVLMYLVTLAARRTIGLTLEVPAWVIWGVLVATALETALLLVTTVVVAVRWPALAVFPALAACWIGADVGALLSTVRAGDGRYRPLRSSTALATGVGGVALTVGLVLVVLRQGGSA